MIDRSKNARIASQRIEILMAMAEEVSSRDMEGARRYAALARRIAMRHTLKFPRRWKRRLCKGCGTFLRPGSNCRIRTRQGVVVITCRECGRVSRVPFTRERKARHEGPRIGEEGAPQQG